MQVLTDTHRHTVASDHKPVAQELHDWSLQWPH